MGGRGAFLETGGFTVYDFEAVRYVEGIKVLEPKNKEKSWDIPHRSNTPGTSYIKVERHGKTAILRKYGQERKPIMDFEYGIDGGVYTWHTHTWKGDVKGKAKSMDDAEKERYARLFKKAGLKL